MKKHIFTTFTLGSAVALSALSMVSHAAESPFAVTTLKSGYQLAAADVKSMEGQCGAAKKAAEEKSKEGKCGAKKEG